jgi:hypothetical protein
MALRNESGDVLDRAAVDALLTPVVDPDPLLTVDEDIYEDFGYRGSTERGTVLKWRAGEKVRTSEVEAAYAEPTVTSVAPNTGPAAGGTAVTITGKGFQSGIRQDSDQGPITGGGSIGATIGGVACTQVAVVSDTKITCHTGAHAAGAAAVVVTTDAGASTALAGGFTYV